MSFTDHESWIREMIVLSLLRDDPDIQHAAGEVAIAHGQLEYILQMTVKSLADISGPEAVLSTRYLSAWERRKLIKRIAKKQGLDERTQLKLSALLERASSVSEERNNVIHRAWGYTDDKKPVTSTDDAKWSPAPSADELWKLAERIFDVAIDLNEARLKGFLKEAIKAAKENLPKA